MRSWCSNVEATPTSKRSSLSLSERARRLAPSRFASFAYFPAFPWGLAALAFVGCGGPLVTVTELPKAPRRPDGVVLEQPLTVPDADEHGKAEDSVVTLREPFESRALVDLVKAYFRAWEHEDVDGLGRMLTADAILLKRPGANVLESFRARLRIYEYQRIAGLEVARFDRIERHGYGDLQSADRPLEMREGDLLVRVPVLVARVSGDPLFGESLVLMVRREEGALRIAGLAEEAASR